MTCIRCSGTAFCTDEDGDRVCLCCGYTVGDGERLAGALQDIWNREYNYNGSRRFRRVREVRV